MDSSLSEHLISSNLRHLAPETITTRQTSVTGDIYSFGVMVYELLTGSTIDGGMDTPLDGEMDLLEDIHRHMTSKIIPPLQWLRRQAHLEGMETTMPPCQLSSIVMKCLEKALEDRYASLAAVKYDLEDLARRCRSGCDLSSFVVGKADGLSRFKLPTAPVSRTEQLDRLGEAFDACRRPAAGVRVVNVHGGSGSGKTRVVRHCVQDLQRSRADDWLVAWSKMDTSTHNPLASFSQLFQHILDQIFTNPGENVSAWRERLLNGLEKDYVSFLAMLPQEYTKLLTVGKRQHELQDTSSDKFIASFRM